MKRIDAIFTTGNDEYGTPQALFENLDAEFNFTLDPCATDQNHKCEKYYTKEDDGMTRSWAGERVFCNPPYSQIKQWARKCREEAEFAMDSGYGRPEYSMAKISYTAQCALDEYGTWIAGILDECVKGADDDTD